MPSQKVADLARINRCPDSLTQTWLHQPRPPPHRGRRRPNRTQVGPHSALQKDNKAEKLVRVMKDIFNYRTLQWGAVVMMGRGDLLAVGALFKGTAPVPMLLRREMASPRCLTTFRSSRGIPCWLSLQGCGVISTHFFNCCFFV